ncbi:MAG: efflux RND transporter permease subunit, partial [Thermodesulfobacteriota bacterium]
MAHRDDKDIIANTHNTARYFTENRHVAWVLLFAVLIWGAFSWMNMPKRKDPDIPVLVAVAICQWPGADAEQVEQLVTKPMEQTIAQNSKLHEPGAGNDFALQSTSLAGYAIIQIQLSEGLADTTQEFNDINLRLKQLNDQLPQGAGPIQFNSGFGNTAARMITVASPKESDLELELRANNINKAIELARNDAGSESGRVSLVVALPTSVDTTALNSVIELLVINLIENGIATNIKEVIGPSFIGLDLSPLVGDQELLDYTFTFTKQKLGLNSFHIDGWDPILVRDIKDTKKKLKEVDGDKYSYRDLENITELITENFQTIEEVSIIQRSGTLSQVIYLDYSQDVFASYGITPAKIKSALNERNIIVPGGEVEVDGTEVIVYPSGAFNSVEEIANVVITETQDGTPVYLRDLGEIVRGYQSPPSLLNFYKWQDDKGNWHRSRAITLAIQMRDKDQIGKFGEALDQATQKLAPLLPSDIIIDKTSDQP